MNLEHILFFCMKNPLIHSFTTDVSDVALPSKFTFPFHYEPHLLALAAAASLQENIISQKWFEKGGLQEEIGKMFGVLVVQEKDGGLGYLNAFSGKLAGSNNHDGFVPSIYDMLDENGYFLRESKKLEAITYELLQLEENAAYHEHITKAKKLQKENEQKLDAQRLKIRLERAARKKYRATQESQLSTAHFKALQEKHNQQRINDRFLLREYEVYLNDKLAVHIDVVRSFQEQVAELKESRRLKSNTVQDYLFAQYNFLNALGESRNVVSIFEEFTGIVPPAGAGDCAAPKLLQYAYSNNLKPIALAEFWWGKQAPSAIRKQGYFYPACRSKCEPILGHMLQGLDVEENPLLQNPAVDKELTFIYEDEHIVVVNKPAEFLSVPGKVITDSVQERLRAKYPQATGPLLVHRLDMSTSGILLVALTKEVHQHLQEQFMSRKVVKQYVALLDGIVNSKEGFIDLPLRVDLDNRPYQMVCYEHGKPARTRYEVVAVENNYTRVHFYPITGRTHQLRMHAAHRDGLNAPILGDDLYGKKKDRLHLHAASLTFKHPISKEQVTFTAETPF